MIINYALIHATGNNQWLLQHTQCTVRIETSPLRISPHHRGTAQINSTRQYSQLQKKEEFKE